MIDKVLGADAPVMLVLAALVVLGTAIKLVGIPVWRAVRRFGYFLDDYFGEEARPGTPARPGISERLTNVEHTVDAIKREVHPNGGSSLRDAVDRVEQSMTENVDRVEKSLTNKLDEHMAESTADRQSLHDALDEHLRESTADREALHRAVDALTTETVEHHEEEQQ